jgi:hypothetical protein
VEESPELALIAVARVLREVRPLGFGGFDVRDGEGVECNVTGGLREVRGCGGALVPSVATSSDACAVRGDAGVFVGRTSTCARMAFS